jgi:RNA polymerase-binding transcription factor DksA
MVAFERKDLDRLKQALERRRDTLLVEVREVHRRDETQPYSVIAGEVRDAGDESVANSQIDTDHAEIERDLAEIHAIDAALERIAAGTYGICVECAERLPRERLAVSPAASRCLACQARFEKTHAHGSWSQR